MLLRSFLSQLCTPKAFPVYSECSMKHQILALAAICGVLLAVAASIVLLRWHRGNITSGPEPEVLNLLPADAPVILYIDATAFRTAPLAAEITALAPRISQEPEYERFVQQTGFDYSRDLRRLAAAIWPRTSPPRAMVIAEGQFDSQKIRTYALSFGKIAQIAGKEVLLVTLHNPEKEIAIAFLSPQLLALSDGVPLGSILTGPPVVPADPEFSDCVRSVVESPFFAVARVDALPQYSTLHSEIEGQLNALFSGARYLTLALQPAGQFLELTLDARTDSLPSALRISTTLEGLRFVGGAALADPRARHRLGPEEAGLLDTILRTAKISHGSKDATVRVTLTPELLRSLSDSATIH
jgi:hypothetical protein